MNDPSCRPDIAQPVKDMEQYDTILIGFPIWWYVEPRNFKEKRWRAIRFLANF